MKNTDLKFTGYSIFPISYLRIRDIMAEFDGSERLLRDALWAGYQVEINDAIAKVAILHVVVDEEMAEKLHAHGITNPTMCQLIGTSRCIALSENDAKMRFEAMMRSQN